MLDRQCACDLKPLTKNRYDELTSEGTYKYRFFFLILCYGSLSDDIEIVELQVRL